MFLCNDVAENIRALGALSTTLVNAAPVRLEPGAHLISLFELAVSIWISRRKF